jgi:glyoxylase-like metal-dependent hydrolase (beta-lactamase superfamily II)
VDAAPAYGPPERLSPLVRRVTARNPGPFTGTGTGTYIVGHGEVAVIDPGPHDPDHLAALDTALAGQTVAAILVTHTHRDHSPAARPLAAMTGAPVMGCAPLALSDDGPRVEEGFDATYAPDRVLTDDATVAGPGWALTALATPGHTSNHLCFALAQEKALFTGDHVMGWSTTVIVPPDGSMRAYLASLRRVAARDDAILYPTHGPPVGKPRAHVRGLIRHRLQREAQIARLLEEGVAAVPDMVARIYAQVDPRLWPAAARSVEAHLIALAEEGRARRAAPGWAPA